MGEIRIQIRGDERDVVEFLNCISPSFSDDNQVEETNSVPLGIQKDGRIIRFAKWENPNT